jgi:hypothetical protein
MQMVEESTAWFSLRLAAPRRIRGIPLRRSRDMHLASRSVPRTAVLVAFALAAFALPASALNVTLRSGQAPAGNPDPNVTRFDLASICGAGYPTPFTAADFAAASSGPPAFVLSFVHGAWGQSLQCDPQAKWIGINPQANPMSALYAIDFDLGDPCCYEAVFLNFCWMSDDILGDPINPAGVYINGQPTTIAGGNYATPTSMSADITNLVHCGRNTLYIHNRDLACAVSGIIFSADIKAIECVTPTAPSSWGRIKSIYR